MKRACLAAMVFMVTSPVVAAAKAEDEPKKEKKICRTEKVTGSLTRVNRICMTQAEWDELNQRNRKGLNDLQASASGASVRRDAEATYGPGGLDPATGQAR